MSICGPLRARTAVFPIVITPGAIAGAASVSFQGKYRNRLDEIAVYYIISMETNRNRECSAQPDITCDTPFLT